MYRPPHIRPAPRALLLALLAGGAANALAQTWDGGGTDNNWSTANNWTGNTVPASNDSTDITFAGTTRLAPNLTGNRTQRSIIFASGAGAFTLGGSSTLTIASGGITNNSSNTQTIASPVFLSSNQTWNTASGNLVVSGPVSSNWITLTKTGSGTLTLSGNNTGLQGPLAINAGTVVLAHSNALGSSTYGNTISSGATLALQSGITVTESNFSVNGSGHGGGGAIRNLSGNNTIAAALDVASASTIGSDGGTLTINGGVNAGSNNLTLAGAGNIVFAQGINSGGTLAITGSGDRTFNGSSVSVSAINANGSGSTVFNTQISNSAYTQSSGNVTFAGTRDNSFTSFNVTGGTLVLDKSSGSAINTSHINISNAEVVFARDNQINVAGNKWTNVTLGEGAVLDLGNTTQAINQLTLTGDAVIDFGSSGSTFDIGNLNVIGDHTLTIVNWNSTVDFFTANVTPGSNLPKIVFEGYGEATWDPYSGGGFITPGAPIPEPGACGLLALGSILAGFLVRRPRRKA